MTLLDSLPGRQAGSRSDTRVLSVRAESRTCVRILCFFILLFSFQSKAQDTVPQKNDDSDIQQQLENAAENSQDEEADYTTLLDALNHFKEHPINLNKTDKEELQSLGLLTDIQINNLLRHIEKTGKLVVIY